MDESELLEILTNISDDLEALRREMRSRLNSELAILRKTVNAMLPHMPHGARAKLADEFREVIAQEAQGAEATLPRTMAILAMPNALLPLYPRYHSDKFESTNDHWETTRPDFTLDRIEANKGVRHG